jgi:hypothetical protein
MNLYSLQKFNKHRLIFLVLIACECINVCFSKVLTNSYLVEFKHDIDSLLADEIALRNGFINKGPVSFYVN